MSCKEWGTFKKWIIKNKDFSSILLSWIIGCSTIIVSCCTISIMLKQTSIIEHQKNIQLAELQPLFQIKNELIDSNSDGFFDTEYLHISNEGKAFKSLINISVKKIIGIKLINDNEKKEKQIPIENYYLVGFKLNNLKGTIYTCFYNGNNQKVHNLDIEALQYKGRYRYCFLCSYDLIRIDYIDADNNKVSIYYKDNQLIDRLQYDSILGQSKRDIGSCVDIDKVSLSDLMKLID